MTSEEFWSRIKALKPFDYIDKSDPDAYVKLVKTGILD